MSLVDKVLALAIRISAEVKGKATKGANSDITSLSGLTTALSISQGGTGATSAAAGRSQLAAAGSGANSDITGLSGLTTAISVSQGGTGATSAAAALSGLGAAARGANSDITALTGLTTALSVSRGGTGATSAATALSALGGAARGANGDITSMTGLSDKGIPSPKVGVTVLAAGAPSQSGIPANDLQTVLQTLKGSIDVTADSIGTQASTIGSINSTYFSRYGTYAMQGLFKSLYGYAALQIGVNDTYKWQMVYNGDSTTALSPFGIFGTTDGFSSSYILGMSLSSNGTPSFGQPVPITQGGTAATTAAAALSALGGLPLSGGTMTGSLVIPADQNAFRALGSTQTSFGLTASSLSADQRSWEVMNGSDGSFIIRTINDSYSAAANAITIVRGTGVDISAINIWKTVLPFTSNAYNLGGPSNLWANIYGATGTVNSSDAELKSIRGLLSESELAAWGEVQWKIYQFLGAVEQKGSDQARLHSGLIAQEVQTAFANHGLDAAKYGLWCSDEIDVTETKTVRKKIKRQKTAPITIEKIEIVDGVPVLKSVIEDRPVTEIKAAIDEAGNALIDSEGLPVMVDVPVMEEVDFEEQIGEVVATITRLGLRYAECSAFEAAYQRSRTMALEARIAALEAAQTSTIT